MAEMSRTRTSLTPDPELWNGRMMKLAQAEKTHRNPVALVAESSAEKAVQGKGKKLKSVVSGSMRDKAH